MVPSNTVPRNRYEKCKLKQNTKVANGNVYVETFKLKLQQISANYNVNTNFKVPTPSFTSNEHSDFYNLKTF